MRPRRAARVAALVVAAPVVAAAAFVAWPLPSRLLDRRAVTSLRILDAEGEPLAVTTAGDAVMSLPLEGNAVPPLVKDAFVAAEDRRFYEHPGVDVRAVFRALKDSLAAGHVVSGASTITQQLARRLVPRSRTLLGKAKEALWALRLSTHLDKERVLLEYANRVPLGHGVVGVEAASRFYFGRPARLLSPAQAALLAGLAHAPAREDPRRHPERALHRRAVVLERMRAAGFLDDDTTAHARDEPLDLAPPERSLRAPHFVQAVRASLDARGLGDAVVVETGIDAELQSEVEHIIDEELSGPLMADHVGNAAVVVVDNATGRILAYAGSRDFFDKEIFGENDGVRAHRQPGSALKPFVYGLAFSRGMTPATLLPDVETTYATESGTYAPRNYDKRIHGPVRARAALQNSYNIPAVHVAEWLGPPAVLDELHRAGFESLTDSAEHYGVGIVLGDGDITLLEMARAYAGLARGGVLHPLVDVVAARDGAGRELPVAREFRPRRFLPKDVVALVTDVLSDTGARTPAFGFDNALDLPFPVAAKTGTSRAYVDNWTAGFTKERTVAVWAGNFDGTPMRHVSGISGAGPIFRRVMLAAMKGIDPAPLVDDSQFDTVRICPLSGLRAGPSCPGAFDEHFLKGTAPRAACGSHHLVAVGASTCSHAARALSLPARYVPWARGEGLRLVDGARLCDAHVAPGTPKLLSPKDGDDFLVEPGVPAGQAIPIKVSAPGADGVFVSVDGGAAIELRAPFSTWVDTKPGTHTVSLSTSRGAAPVEVARVVVR